MDAPFIAGFDGSPAASAAVRVTTHLASSAGAPVVVAHAFAPGHDIADARAASDELLAHVNEPGARTRSIAAHSAVDGLRDAADYERAALLAVGRTHYGVVGRAIDSVPGQLLHHAPCPLLVVPADAGIDFGVVGVAFDGRAESRAALAVARDIARALGARIVLLGVGESPSFVGTDGEAGDGALESRALHGPVAQALAHACDEGIDLLVTGSRAHGPFATVVAGSVSRHLADHAPCPVLVVPRGVTGLHGTGPRTVSAGDPRRSIASDRQQRSNRDPLRGVSP
jgi:nucleotide-binding universal stress UspA family protein